MLHTLENISTTAAVEDCIKTIHALERDRPGAVSTNAIADRLGITPASASAMVKRLAEQGLVDHQPYRGAALTHTGTRAALEVIRHHRLLETFLAEEVGMPWEQVHAEADRLEHVLSEELEALIASKLGHPDRDPHGDPIPTVELELAEDDSVRLATLNVGSRGVFTRISDSDPAMLQYLAGRGIALGDSFEVVDRQPFGGPIFARFGDEIHALGGPLSEAMRVQAS